MEADELFNVVKRHPLDPVRIHLSDGSFYDVTHPGQVMVGRQACHVGLRGDGTGPFQQIARLANMHITRIEPLAKSTTGQ